MRFAAGLAAACTVTALGAVPAVAKPAKSCNLLADPANDARPNDLVPSDDSLDIVSGDFASNGRKITGIIRVKALQPVNPRAPLGQVFVITFRVVGVTAPLTLTATLAPTGNQFHYGYQGPEPATGTPTAYHFGVATGKVAGNEVRITAEIAKFPQQERLANGKPVTFLTADARALVGQQVAGSRDVDTVRVPLSGVTLAVDGAVGKRYTLGTRSCVVIG